MPHENTAVQDIYVHGGGEANDEMNELWEPEADQQIKAHYACYEDTVTVEFDLDTGQFRYLALDGHKLETPTEWST